MNTILKIEKLLHGGDYNPEQWLSYPELLEQDIVYFKKAHINEVSMGMFSWSMLEPREGEYQFDWLEQMIERLYKNGISVILATPSGARPKWLADKYPEVLRVDESRHRNFYGLRHNHCYTSPIYREKTWRINQELAKRFGNHPAVLAWHISNEYGGECHCELCQEAFRRWLERKYKTIDKLNEAWATTFWSHTYNDFSQVESPSSRGEAALHGLNLDWKRFVTDQTVDFAKYEIQALQAAGSNKPTTVNLMYDYQGLNYHKFAEVVTMISWDNYPQWHKKQEYLTAMDCGMQHDIMRSIQKKPFLLMESCPSATNWQPISKLKKPRMLHASSLQAIAHGSDSVLYFQLRQSRGASEKFHGAVIDHYGGDDTRVFQEVTRIGADLMRLSEVAGTQTKANVAVIFDWENRWALEDAQGPRNEGLFYKEAVEKSYYAFRKQGLDVDVIDMQQDFSEYQILAAPMLYLFQPDFPKRVRKFVADGGTLILTYWSGIVNETDLCYLGGTPYGLLDVLGLRSTEIDALYQDEYNVGVSVSGNAMGLDGAWKCSHLCDLVKISTAEVLAVYEKDFYQGMPALTRNHYGKGCAYYVCADFEQSFYDECYRKIANEQGVQGLLADIPEGVEVNSRSSEQYQYLFVQNFNRHAVKISLPMENMEVLLGTYDGSVINAWDTIVLKKVREKQE